MAKLRKVAQAVKTCVKEPKYIKKGINYVYQNGLSGLKGKIGSTINTDEPVPVQMQEDSSPDKKYNSNIKFSIVMPVYNVEIKWLEKAIQSVKNQNYVNWELCIADDCSTKKEVREYLSKIHEDKIKIVLLEKNGGISVASNEAAKLATGDYIVLMDNDDEITYDALYEFLRAVKEKNADVIYSDQNIIDVNGVGREPLHKPDWSPELFLSQMYLGHLVGFRRELFIEVGGFRSEFNGSQDYDLLLRITEKSERVEHVSKVLYGWRDIPSSTATNPEAKPYAQTAGLKAIQEHLDRTLGAGRAKANETEDLFVYDVRYSLETKPLVSVIIPTKDHVDLLENLLNSIYKKTAYENFELLILNNNSEEKKSFDYFEKIQKEHQNIRVIEASYPFNWSALNNHGIREAKGDVYIFMNNDMEILTKDWMERLVEKAVLPETGIVGGLLLYEDNTIQHAGVVVGICGYADHIYKGCKPVHYGSPFISPMVTRNVMACTGALMAVSRKTIEFIGDFDDEFIICGSDVEICIRAYNKGLRNIYDPHVRLYHYESKSRDSYIPEIDFEMSEFAYRTCKEEGDPYYNKCLDYSKLIPTETPNIQFVKPESDIMKYINMQGNNTMMKDSDVEVAEILQYNFRKSKFEEPRLNLLVPSVNPEHVFGGISTALKFFEELTEQSGYASRIILTDALPSREAIRKYGEKYRYVRCTKDCDARHQLVPYSDRWQRSIPVSSKDIFVFTGWWTAYCTQEAYLKFEQEQNIAPNPFIYFIQDYEPGFYPWSTRYLLADSTYRSDRKQIAIFNSGLLYEFFRENKYAFYREYAFEPVLNAGLKKELSEHAGETVNKKRQILVYGRPSVDRNAFSLVVSSLKKFVERMDSAENWEFVSAGEYHDKVNIGKGKSLTSVGKVTIEEYARLMMESYAGISLMSSPHPSYPPLEMSEFGVRVITNNYANKDLSVFNKNITSVSNVSPDNIAMQLEKICKDYTADYRLEVLNQEYVENNHVFSFIDKILEDLKLS